MSKAYLLVNFGGPRTLAEITPFLTSLLTDKECVRTNFPQVLQNYLFTKIAKKRAKRIEPEYKELGGGSPIFADTEAVKEALAEKVEAPVYTYHRYLPMTHQATFSALEAEEAKEIYVFPMFPQFSYATTGSAAKQLFQKLSRRTQNKLIWVKSYANHPQFVRLFVSRIKEYMQQKQLEEKKTILLFSAHGIPKSFVERGDPYELECKQSFEEISAHFPKVKSRLAFQSKFGPGEWLRPYTEDVCKTILEWNEGRENVLFVPLSFTSDHIETLIEIEKEYMPPIREAGLQAHRLSAFNRGEDWVEVIKSIVLQFIPTTTPMLVRNKKG